jgi:hypothetical protein
MQHATQSFYSVRLLDIKKVLIDLKWHAMVHITLSQDCCSLLQERGFSIFSHNVSIILAGDILIHDNFFQEPPATDGRDDANAATGKLGNQWNICF